MDQQKRKITQLVPQFLPSLGGVEKHVAAITEDLVSRDFDVTIITTQHEKTLKLYENNGAVHIYRIPFEAIDNKKATWQWIQKHSNLFTNTIVHVHDVTWWLVPLLPTIYKKFFITFHGWEGIYPVPLVNKLQRLYFSGAAKKTIHVGHYIQKFYWDKPSLVLYGGVQDKVQPKFSQALPKNLHISFLGRLEMVNEIEKYLEVIQILLANNSEVKINWVGDGSFRSNCEKLGTVTGMVKNVSSYIQKSDLIFSASYLSILESQQAGKLVCSMYSNRLKESYLKTYPASSALVISDDASKVVERIESLRDNPNEYQVLVKKGYEFASQQTWKKITDQYIGLWNS